jgi:elongation factor 2
MLTAEPRLMEPVYLVTVQCPSQALAAVYNAFGTREGYVISEEEKGTMTLQ